ncbi:hypothetical protein Tco_0763128 [Tanacetum coccineum]
MLVDFISLESLKVLGVTSPEYVVDELFETDSYESGDWDWEEEGSEVDEFHSVSDENVDRDDPLLDEGAEVGNRSHSDSFESRDDESS